MSPPDGRSGAAAPSAAHEPSAGPPPGRPAPAWRDGTQRQGCPDKRAFVAHPLRGAALFVLALFFFAVLDATAKHLSRTWPVPLLVWARYALHFLIMMVVLAPSMGHRLVATGQPRRQVVRGLMLVGTTAFGMLALSRMPLAETTAIFFVTPLIVTLMAGPWLGEHISAGRWIAVAVGFAGVLLIARPGGTVDALGLAAILGGALCYSIYQIMTRQLSATEPTLRLLFYTALVGAVVSSLALPWYWRGPAPDALQLLLFCSLGIYGGVGHFLLIRAFRHAPASALSPLLYIQLVWATLLGGILFGHWPDGPSIAGGLLIAASGAAVVLGQRRRAPG